MTGLRTNRIPKAIADNLWPKDEYECIPEAPERRLNGHSGRTCTQGHDHDPKARSGDSRPSQIRLEII